LFIKANHTFTIAFPKQVLAWSGCLNFAGISFWCEPAPGRETELLAVTRKKRVSGNSCNPVAMNGLLTIEPPEIRERKAGRGCHVNQDDTPFHMEPVHTGISRFGYFPPSQGLPVSCT
jgi:hypothetical protein